MKKIYLLLILLLNVAICSAKHHQISVADFGLTPASKNASGYIADAIKSIKKSVKKGDKVTLSFPKGVYNFHEENSSERIYYISNHDQNNPKKVGIAIEDIDNFTLEGNGSEFIFHGTMIPLAILRCENSNFKNFSIDFKNPHIAQSTIISSDSKGITFKPAPWVKYKIQDGAYITYGEGWASKGISSGIAFDHNTRNIIYNTSDIGFNLTDLVENTDGTILAPHWKDNRLKAGNVVAMRQWKRPTPGIFLSHNKDTHILNVTVHYSEGMGLLAQMSENITLDGFRTSLRGDDDPRYFTTQADATHFSGCKGKIVSVNGLYEGMMDDAINVHGTYLKIIKIIDKNVVIGRYMHSQSWGFEWGMKGDKVQFVESKKMELVDGENRIEEITPYDIDQIEGAKEYKITFKSDIPETMVEGGSYGIENLTWTAKVHFENNVIRNNRARGTLFSTPKRVVVKNNVFDHTSGSAILLCGDCNGWYETGACKNVVIKNNKFINSLTCMFQFTNAIISIYPEIPNLDQQVKYFHGGSRRAIRIKNNYFSTFDNPILYAKSVDGLVFKNNVIEQNSDFPSFHWNKERVLLERVERMKMKNNTYIE